MEKSDLKPGIFMAWPSPQYDPGIALLCLVTEITNDGFRYYSFFKDKIEEYLFKSDSPFPFPPLSKASVISQEEAKKRMETKRQNCLNAYQEEAKKLEEETTQHLANMQGHLKDMLFYGATQQLLLPGTGNLCEIVNYLKENKEFAGEMSIL